MKAKSAVLSSTRRPAAEKPPNGKRRSTARMPAAQRRAQIQAKAFEFFSEYGLTAQTRALYEAEIAGPFKAIWFVQLRDRTVPLADRLNNFYREYYDTILTRRWLRLFLYSSLAEVEIAPTYIAAIIRTLLQTIVEEAAADCGVAPPSEPGLAQEIGWVLHGNISHLAIRRHVYGDGSSIAVPRVIAMHVAAFLAALPGILAIGQGEQVR
jgi:hypothetical protein